MELAFLEEHVFLTWEFLGTFMGAVIGVTTLTQVIKIFIKIDPKWISLALATAIMLVVQINVAGDFRVESFVISAFNALLVTGASIGLFESAVKNIARRIKPKEDNNE
jgi:hypothetical protein